MSAIGPQILPTAEVHTADEIQSAAASLVTGQQSTSILQLAMTALRLSTPPSSDRNNNKNNLRLRKQITLSEVAYHDTFDDCWLVLYDRVYDITKFLELHPGGYDVLLENAGRDATIAFMGSGHSKAAVVSLTMYEIGELPLHECIYRCPGKLSATMLPD